MTERDENLLALIKACIKKEEDAWRVFIEEYGKTIAKFTKRTVKEEKEDITQRVLLRLCTGGLKNFDGKTQNEFRGYLWQVTSNEVNTYLRSKIKWEKEISIDERPGAPHSFQLTNIPTDSPSPEEAAMLAERRERLERCFKNLSWERQQIFFMKVQKGLKDREVGELLGIKEGTVASNYSRLKEELEECVQKKS